MLAIDCAGGVRVITRHAPAMEGGIGVESAGFVPPGFSAGDAAFLADRFLQGQPAPGLSQLLHR